MAARCAEKIAPIRESGNQLLCPGRIWVLGWEKLGLGLCFLVPSGKLTQEWKTTMFNGQINYKL